MLQENVAYHTSAGSTHHHNMLGLNSFIVHPKPDFTLQKHPTIFQENLVLKSPVMSLKCFKLHRFQGAAPDRTGESSPHPRPPSLAPPHHALGNVSLTNETFWLDALHLNNQS